MKYGDLVKKRWGKINPEEADTIGLLVKVEQPTSRGWTMVTVLYHFGERVFPKDDVEVVNENR